MEPKHRLLIILVILTAALLACATASELVQTPTTPPTDTPVPPVPTNTPLPPPTEEPVLTLVAGSDDMLFFDDFSSSESGWDRFSAEEGFTDYSDGAYKIGVYIKSMFYWANPYQNFEDAAIEVIATKSSGGDDVQFGIICRHQDVDNFYALVVSADGFAAIRKRYQGGDLEYIAEWVDALVINQGNATNLLRAECIGTRLALFANGVLLLEVNDDDIPVGDVGLLAGTFSENSVEVLFDNFSVTSP